MKTIYKFTFTLVILVAIPTITSACSVCKGGYSDDELGAYYLTTGLLALAPVIIMLVTFGWIWKRYKQARQEDEYGIH